MWKIVDVLIKISVPVSPARSLKMFSSFNKIFHFSLKYMIEFDISYTPFIHCFYEGLAFCVSRLLCCS